MHAKGSDAKPHVPLYKIEVVEEKNLFDVVKLYQSVKFGNRDDLDSKDDDDSNEDSDSDVFNLPKNNA